jgi:hypothetical protein
MRARFFFAIGLAGLVAILAFNHSPMLVLEEGRVAAAPAVAVPTVTVKAIEGVETKTQEASVPEEVFPEPNLAPKLDLRSGPLPWEERVKAITGSTTLSEAAKARELLRNLISLPEEGLEFATQQAADRLPDKEFAAALGLLINPQTHGRVLQVLFADLLERPDEITLPALLSIARNETHPFARQARDNLGLLVGKDFGANWNSWDAEIRRLLKTPGL